VKLVQQRRPAEYVRSQVSSARLAAMWAVIEAKERKAARRGPASRWWVAGALAASLAVVLFFAVGRWHRPLTAAPMAGVVIDTGEAVQAVSLPEGSELELGPVTRLRIMTVSEHEVRLRLEKGRVSCDATHVEGRRFVVEAGDTEVEVKGTRFEVTATPTAEGRLSVSVRVERGAVTVRDGTRAELALLLPGEMWLNQPPPDAGAIESPPAADSASTAPPPVVSAPPVTVTARALFERADEARLAGRHAEAAAELERLLARFPHDPRAPVAAYGLGRLRLGPLHDAAGAVAAFRIAIERDPGGVFREDAEVGRMQATEILGDVAQCKRLREAFVARYPASVQTARIRKLCNGS
jgi:transmembrane sensor